MEGTPMDAMTAPEPFGVTVTSGVCDWQILSRDRSGVARVRLGGHARPGRISAEPPFRYDDSSPERLEVSARVVAEGDGGLVVGWTTAELRPDGGWVVDLTIPEGGPYRIETQLTQAGGDGLVFTRGDVLHHVGVGDVYLVLGQSNAAGRARDQVEDGPSLGVHQFHADGRWRLASHPLNDGTRSVFTGHLENHNTGHSPALRFAKRIQAAAGVPVGLVVAAFGGAPLRWWVDGGELAPLSRNALEMVAASGARPRGVLWYQGEADCYEASADDYADRFTTLVRLLRDAVGDSDLPFYTAQLARCTQDPGEHLDRAWGVLREQQRQAARRLSRVYVLPTGDLPLYDSIHLSSAANLVIAERLADAALAEDYGLVRHWRAPEPVSVRRVGDTTIAVTFAPVMNWINDFELPARRCPFDVEDAAGSCEVTGWRVDGADIELDLARRPGEGAVVHGMWRMDHGGIVPADCTRMPFLSFYGVPVA